MIVVGVDGSDESKKALAWAVEEARYRGQSVRAVCAWTSPTFSASFAYVPVDAIDPRTLRASAEAMVEEVVEEVVGGESDVPVHAKSVEGSAASVLVRQAEGAEMLVLGSRGRGGFTGLLLGSVSQQCAHYASCPVVIIRSPRAE